MANQLSASIYAVGTNAIGTAQGVTMSFPTQGIRIEPANLSLGTNLTFNGETMASCIQLLPTGLNVNEKRFYSSTAVATLVTAANA